MKLKVLGSGSSGNCYLLENEKECLIIECGIRMDKIKQGLNFNTRKVSGCLITHEHKDHCKAVEDMLKCGIKIFATPGTINAMGVKGTSHRIFEINPGIEFNIGDFKILPFEVHHDAAQPVGFMINHAETGNVLFITDTYYVEHKFSNLNNIIVEANYSKDILDAKVGSGSVDSFLADRIRKSHLSLENCKKLLEANDLSAVNNIVLIHLSDSNSDMTRFKSEVAQCTGKMVHIAQSGLVLENFNKKVF